MMEWILERAKEPSTWKGLSLILALTGVNVAPELAWQIGEAVIAVIGAIEVMRKEK